MSCCCNWAGRVAAGLERVGEYRAILERIAVIGPAGQYARDALFEFDKAVKSVRMGR